MEKDANAFSLTYFTNANQRMMNVLQITVPKKASKSITIRKDTLLNVYNKLRCIIY